MSSVCRPTCCPGTRSSRWRIILAPTPWRRYADIVQTSTTKAFETPSESMRAIPTTRSPSRANTTCCDCSNARRSASALRPLSQSSAARSAFASSQSIPSSDPSTRTAMAAAILRSAAARGVAAEERERAATQPDRGALLIRGRREQAILGRVRHEAHLDEDHRHVRPVEAGVVGAFLEAAVREAERGSKLTLDDPRGAPALAVDVIRPAVPQCRVERVRPPCGGVRGAVRMDPQEERRPLAVRDPRTRDVADARPGRPRPRHDDAYACPLEKHPQPQCDPQIEIGLAQPADDTVRPATVLDLHRRRTGADRLRR